MGRLSEINEWQAVSSALPRLADRLPVCTIMSSYLSGGSVLSYMTARRELASWVKDQKTLDCTLHVSNDLMTLRIDSEIGGCWRWARVGKKNADHLSYRLRLGVMSFWLPECREAVGVEHETKGNTLFARVPDNWLAPRVPHVIAKTGAKVVVPEFISTIRFSLAERWILEQMITAGRRCGVEYICECLQMDRGTFARLLVGLNKKLRQGVIVHEGIMETSGTLALTQKDREQLQVMVAEAKVKAPRG